MESVSQYSSLTAQVDCKMTYKVRFRMFPYLLMASTGFFLPLTASRVYETAYGLSFTRVNNYSLQACLALTAFWLFILIAAVPRLRLRVLLPASTVFSIIFQIVIAFTQGLGHLMYLLHLYPSF